MRRRAARLALGAAVWLVVACQSTGQNETARGAFQISAIDIPATAWTWSCPNAAGDVAIPRRPFDAITVISGGQTRSVVRAGDPAPGGERFKLFQPFVALNAAGHVLFGAVLEHDRTGLFVARDGGIARIVGRGDPTPAGGVFSDVLGVDTLALPFLYALNRAGQVAFVGGVKGGATEGGVFLASGPIEPVVVVGQSLPGFPAFVATTNPALNDRGDVAFFASTEGMNRGGIFIRSGSTFRKVAVTGDPAPIGGRFEGLGSPLFLNSRRDLTFGATTTEGKVGLFVASGDGIDKVVADGDPRPSGGTFAFSMAGPISSPPWGCLDDAGRIIFRSSDGQAFMAEPWPNSGRPGALLARNVPGPGPGFSRSPRGSSRR